MALNIDRRSLIVGAGLGLGALVLPSGRGLAQQILGAKGFTHNVASGEPGPDSMLLWTRYVPAADDHTIRLQVEVALDSDFAKPVSGGSVQTGAWRDWTAKITVDGLKPGTVYWYRFVAPDGSKSPVGRTRTLPVGDAGRFGLGVFSCSNLPYGWFNAYGHAAARSDLDLWLHVGDYIYEYGTPAVTDVRVLNERTLAPGHEILAIADYRMRYACYRADPDLQRLHQMAPMVAFWDDHEIEQRQLGRRRAEPPAGEGGRLEPAPRRRDAGLSRMDAGVGRAVEGLSDRNARDALSHRIAAARRAPSRPISMPPTKRRSRCCAQGLPRRRSGTIPRRRCSARRRKAGWRMR